jgi:hypothetical protein
MNVMWVQCLYGNQIFGCGKIYYYIIVSNFM